MISVIVPTYNDEATIERCIFSVLSQQYTDWELIFVNDCSTDGTSAIINHYEELYPGKVKVVNNKKNVGAGKSRKNGWKKAKGEFITFLDADDYILPNFLGTMLQLQQQQDSDVVYTSYIIYWPESGTTKVLESPDCVYEGEATCQSHFSQEKKFLTGKLFRKSIIKNIPWSERRIGEDIQTLFFATYEAKRVRSTKFGGYVHVFRRGSLLADAPEFKCGVESMLAENEMLDYLIEKKDEKLTKHILSQHMLICQELQRRIDTKEAGEELIKEYEGKWADVCKWLENHKELIENALN